MKTLEQIYFEGLLDIDQTDKELTAEIRTEWLKQNGTGQFKVMALKDGTMKVWGKVIIKTTDDSLPPLKISYLEGNIYIEKCPNLTNLKSLFASEYSKCKGSVNITACPKLDSLEGLPAFIDDWIRITDCKSFKSLETLPKSAEGVSIIKCGKRFTKSQIEQKCNTIHVLCSAETDEELITEMVNEAVMDPNIARFWKQVQKDKPGFKLQDITSQNVELDQIAPSDCTTYNTYTTDDKKLATALRSLVSTREGFVLAEDDKHDFIYALSIRWGARYVYLMYPKDPAKRPGGFYYWGTNPNEESATGFINWVTKYARELNIHWLHFYRLDVDSFNARAKKRNDRHSSRIGMVDMSDEGLKEFAKEQKERYRKAVAQLKSLKQSEKYLAVANKVEAIMNRFNKVITKMIKDPAWAKANDWKISHVFDAIRQGYNSSSRSQRYGVLYSFKNWAQAIVKDMSGESSTWDKPDGYKKQLDDALAWADKELSAIGL